MTLTLQSVSKISKLEITNKPCDKITSSHLLHYESASPVQDQDQDNHNNNKNDNDNCLSLSTRLQESNTLHESRNTNGHYHHQHQNMLHRQFPSFSLHLSPFHQPIFNPNFIKSSKENYINPIFDTNLHQVILPIECGRNAALMFLSKLCQGSKGSCILFESCYWLTPNEFQCISGRETAKDWKRSIRHNGKSIKLLINKGILTVHSPLCECGTATPSSIKIGKLDMHQYSEGENCISSLHKNEGMKIIGGSVDANFTSKDSYGARWNKEVADYQEREDGSGSHRIVDSLGESETDDSASSPEWTFSSGFGGDRRLSHLPRIPRLVHSSDNHNLVNVEDRDELILSVSVSGGGVGDLGPQSRSSSDASSSSISTLTAAESQSEETSITGSATNMNNNNDSPTPPKSNKRKNKAIVVKNERHSPQLSSSTTSPPMTPPPSTSQNTGTAGASPPPQPIKQMELMMGSGSRNYSDFMRSLAAKYNQQSTTMTPDYYSRTSPANFAFDTRFLKPAAAAALLNLSCSQIPSSLFGDKEKFMDMSSTSTLLSMVRSASAAAANNLESLKANSSSQSHHNKRPNSPLDLSSRDTPNTPPPVKKSKQRNPLDAMTLKSANAANTSISSPCLSSCSTGCTEEAQTMISWSVDEVCRFVSNIDLCKDYVEVFREHAIDGSSLPLLTEEHLMNGMGMKLGPILKFRSTIARKLGTCVICSHCSHCHNNNVNTNSP